MSLPGRHNRLVPVALQPWGPTLAQAWGWQGAGSGRKWRRPAAWLVCEEKPKRAHGRCRGCDRQLVCHGGTEAVSFVKEELPKLLGKEWRPNGRERLKLAFDKADWALSEHLLKGQKEGETTISNAAYSLSSGVCACVPLRDSGEPW